MALDVRASISACFAIGLSITISACALHPLPENVTGVTTDTIVRKTRCEARSAVKRLLVGFLGRFPVGSSEHRLAEEFDASDTALRSFSENQFQGDTRKLIHTFAESAIAYDFTLDITEINNLDATVDLLNPFHKGTASATLGAGVDRTRESMRVFTVSDTFSGLLTKIDGSYCDIDIRHSDYIYPIVGKIGVDEEVEIFVELTLFNNLAGKDKGPPTLTDTLIFTTKLSGSAAPKIAFTPVGSAAHVMDATLMANASRTDVHKVVIGLALPPSPDSSTKKPRSPAKGLFVTVDGTPAQQAAGEAIDQSYLRRGTERLGGTFLLPLNGGE